MAGAGAALLLAAGVFAASAGFAFAYDDMHVIVRNPVVHSLDNWTAILTSRWWNDALYRPLTLLSLAVDWWLGGGSPLVFHVVNVLLHVAVTVLVYVLAAPAVGRFGAALAAMLFAVHPVHVEAVANVVGRAELMAALWVLGAAVAYRWDGALAARGGASRLRAAAHVITLLCVLFALASKESAFAVPALLLLVDWLDAAVAGERASTRFRRHAGLWIASVVVTAIWLVIWMERVGGLTAGGVAPGLTGLSLPGRAIAMLPVAIEYVRLLLFPASLSMDYSPDFLVVGPGFGLAAAIGLALIAVLALVAIRSRRRRPAVTFGIIWAGLTLAVVSNVLVPSEIVLAERTMYLPSAGAVIAVGALAAWIEPRGRIATTVVFAVVVTAAVVRTIVRVPVWRDDGSVFRQLVRDAPGSFRAAWVAGMLAYQAGDRTGGERLLREAARIYPREPGVLSDLGNRLEEDKRWDESARMLAAAYRIDPRRSILAARAIDAWVRSHTLDSAAALLVEAWPADSTAIPLRIARSDLALASGRAREAMEVREAVARQAGRVWQYWYLTAEAALEAGACEGSAQAIGRVRELIPALPALDSLDLKRRKLACASP